MLIEQVLAKSALDKILSNFDLGKIKSISSLATSGNIAYIIESSQGKFVLRLSPTGKKWRSKKEILAELELINYLLKNDFPVPEPLKDKNNNYLVFWKNHHGYLRKYISGRYKSRPTLKEIKDFGCLLGRFHELIENYKTKFKRVHIWDLQETQKYFIEIKSSILKSDFKESVKFVEEFEKQIFSLKFPDNLLKGMIHEDLGRRHILWNQNQIVGLIDFDRSYYGQLILDLGQACRGWCFTNNWQKWEQKKFRALLSGYQKYRRLSESEKKYLSTAIKFAILERSLSFCSRYINVTKDKDDEKYAWLSINKLIKIKKPL